jgi:hypothetical protein
MPRSYLVECLLLLFGPSICLFIFGPISVISF